MTKTKAVEDYIETGNKAKYARDLGYKTQSRGSSEMLTVLREYVIKNK